MFKRMINWIKKMLKRIRNAALRATLKAMAWLKENPELVLAGAPFVIRGAKSIYRKHAKSASQKWAEKERYRIDHTYYDRSHDIYYELKRKMTNNDSKMFATLRDQGYSAFQALQFLNLI